MMNGNESNFQFLSSTEVPHNVIMEYIQKYSTKLLWILVEPPPTLHNLFSYFNRR